MLHVAAPGGNVNIIAVQNESEGDEDLAHQILFKLRAEQGVDLFRLKLNAGGRLFLGDHVHHTVDDLAAAKHLHKLAGALDGLDGVHHVEALFIAGGGVGAHTESACRAAHGNAVEVGGLEEHHRRVTDDLAVRAAHHARDAHRLVLVADAEHIRRKLALVAVKRLNGLALVRGAHDDVAALDAAEVKSVHRLTVLEHDVVGNINDVVDRAHAAVAQSLAHPARGRRDLDVFHHARGVARAEVAVLNVNVDDLRDAAAAALDLGCVQLERALEGRARLACKADNAQAVGAVGRDLELDDGIIETENARHVETRLGVLFLQNEDAVGDAVRELLLLGVQIFERADGIALGVVGNKVALVEVRAARIGHGGRIAEVEAGVERAVAQRGALKHLGGNHRAVDLVAGLDVGGNGGLILVDGVIVVQNGGRRDNSIGEVVLRRHAKLLERAEHTVGLDAAQRALFDLDAAGQMCAGKRSGNIVAHMDVPRAGDDLHRLRLTNVDLHDPHVVGVFVALYFENFADDHVLEVFVGPLDGLDLRAGERHLVIEFLIGDILEVNELVEPITG